MSTRQLHWGIVFTSLALLGADSPPGPTVRAQEGRVVSIAEIKQGRDGLLVMSDTKGKNRQVLRVLAHARISLNRTSITLGELKGGDRVIVATDRYDFVTEILATRDRNPVVTASISRY